VLQNPGRNGLARDPPAAGAPKITKTTITINVPSGPNML
jgi:hypothetical protein